MEGGRERKVREEEKRKVKVKRVDAEYEGKATIHSILALPISAVPIILFVFYSTRIVG